MTEPDLAASPCISICLLNEDDICVGCYRSADEIRLWSRCDHQERIEVNRRALARGREINSLA